MEEETQVSSVEVQVTKVADNAGHTPSAMVQGGEMDIAINGGLHQTTKEEEETALDGEFIKVEKESASVPERTSSRDSIEPSERMKMLELELERVAKELQHSELEKAQLKDEVVVSKEKLEGKAKHYEDLELNQKRLQEQIKESEEKYRTQLDALQEALGAQEAKHKELIGMKEAFDGLNVELEISKKKMQEVEQELQSSASDARKFEELSKQRGSHAEFESQKALEFERLLEMATSSAKEMEDQVTSVQEELKGLYEKIAENQRTEEALNSTIADLSAVRGELELSKAQLLNMEEKISSSDVVINELTQELNMRKASEEQMKEDIVALENLFSSAKEDLRVKVASLEEIELKLQEEVKMKEAVEVILKNREADISSLQEELAKVKGEKASLEIAVDDLNSNMLQMKELCSDLETKLKLSGDDFSKADSLLSQALSHNAELEEKIQALETLHQESGTVAATATQRNLELEDIIRTCSTAEEEAKSQLRDIEMRLISVEQKNIELEQQLNMAEIKKTEADRELKEYSDKTSELTALLKGFEEESVKLKMQLKEYEEKITHVESTLSLSSLRNSELEQELKVAVEKCAEHEGRASMMHQRSLELEDLIQMSQSKAEEAGKKVGEMQQLLGSSNYSLRELEEQIAISGKRCQDAEAESKQHSDRVSELIAELETFQAKSSSLEIAFQVANEKELELRESLNIANEEREKYEGVAKSSSEKLSETENLIEVLHNELKSAQDKLESIELDLKNSGIKESEIMEKLKSAEEKLEEQSRIMEQVNARSAEFELLHQSLAKDSEAKLQEAIESISQKDSQATELYKKLKTIEDQAIIYQEQVAEAAEREASLRAELADSSAKLVSQQETIDELKSKIIEVESRIGQSFSEKELIEETNLKLKQELETHLIKINEHQELLSAVHVEKEAISKQLASHMKTITELTDQHSRGLELQSSTESRARDAELQLQEAIEKFNQKDSYAQDLVEKLTALETQVKLSKEHANEAIAAAENQKVELEEALLKLNESFSENKLLAETNLKLKQELETHLIKINEHQELLSAVHVEKEAISEQLASHKKTITELTDQHSRGLELQSSFESRARDAELQLQVAIEKFNQKDSCAKDLIEKLTALETQVKLSEEQANEAVAAAESRKVELEEALLKLKQSFSENKLLAETNLKLKQELETHLIKINEHQELLSAVHVEKEAISEQLASHKKTIIELTDQHSRGLELQSSFESRARDAELQLQVAIEKFNQKDSCAKDLIEKLTALETQVKLSEEQANEAVAAAESRKVELEEALLKLKQSFSENKLLAETNLKLKQELETHMIKINEHQELLSAVHVEKEAISEQLVSHMKTITELTDQHSRGLELQSSTESRARDAELQLQEAIEKFNQKDSYAQDLVEKLTALESQIKLSEERANEAVAAAKSQKVELEEALLRLNQSFSENKLLAETNLKLKQELETHLIKINEHQELLSAVHVEKEVISEQLTSHMKTISELTDQHSRGLELQSSTESRARDAELQLQVAIEKFNQKDSYAKDLIEKLTALETQVKLSEEHANEAVAATESQKVELEEAFLKLHESFSENKLLAETNLKLKQELEIHLIKINEHQELLSAVHVEKEAISEHLASHKKTITELTDQHSRGLELQSSTESRVRDAELQLQLAIEKFNQKDSYAKDLIEKLTALETQVKLSEEHANVAVVAAESRKVELEEALLKLNQLDGIVGELESKAGQFETKNEGLAEANLKLTQELAAYETKMNELQTALNAAFVEKEETLEQLHSSKKTIEDLSQQLVAEGHKLQSQISSVMEENNLLTKTYQDAKEELQAVIGQLETQVSEQKARENALSSVVENLKAELTEKSVLQTRIEELEKQLLLAKTHLKEEVESLRAVAAEKEAGLTSQLEEHATRLQERDALHEQVALLQMELNLAHTTIAEQKEADSRKGVDSEAALKLLQVEIEAKQQQTILLAKQVEELEQKLQLAEAKYNEKDIEDAKKLALLNAELDNLKDKLSESAESEQKIIELENQLKLAKSKSEEQAKEGIQSEVKDGVEVASRDPGSMVSTPSKGKVRKMIWKKIISNFRNLFS